MDHKNIVVLGLETSCDETATAVVREDGTILSNLVLSQMKEHRAFGGVVPEIAARSHLDALPKLAQAAMEDAGVTFSDLDGIAATSGPGLIGGVLIGMMMAKTMAAAHNLPFLAVNHLEGHALTPRLTDNIKFPYLLLLISGGHSQLLVVEGVGQYKRLGTTLDDAAGECFDKSAKLMGLPYPGGPHLEKIAQTCTDQDVALARFPLPKPMYKRKSPDMSFSGLKTAVRTHVQNLPSGTLKRSDIADLSFAFQKTMADILRERTDRAINMFLNQYTPDQPRLVVSGGVAANTAIRNALKDLADEYGAAFFAPPLHLCSDNAAMIAWAGLEHLKKGHKDPLDFEARPRWPLDPDAPKRHGAGIKA